MSKPIASDDKRWKYGELEIDDILDAAASIVRSKGIEALTMRGLAKELGISAMSAYHYVSDKKHLHSLLSDRVLSTIQIPQNASWREQIRATYISIYHKCTEYPGLLLVSQSFHAESDGGRISSELIDILDNTGIEAKEVRSWVMTVTHHLMGFVQWEWMMRESEAYNKPRGFLGHYTRGLDFLLDGLEAKISSSDQ